MDYCELLYKAQENKVNASHKEVRCYSTAFDAPKKLERSKVSSENIKRFLARKEEEEKKKLLQAKRKKDELLALRSQDKKAQKRVQVMLKRTKSANKSVMADAIDNVNTADTLAGPTQCDEDDYGYVSQEASAYYNKLMDKYQNMPSEKNYFSKKKSEVKDLNAAKDRVKAALQKEAEDELLPHKRKRKKKENDETETEQNYKNDIDEIPKEEVSKFVEKPKKPKRAMPPPVDFEQLLKIAEKKQFEPIKLEKIEVEKEPERLMTKKEKLEYMKEKERRAQKELGNQGKQNVDKKSNGSDTEAQKPNQSSKKPAEIKKKEQIESSNNIPSKHKFKIPVTPTSDTLSSKTPPKNEKVKEKGIPDSLESRLQKSATVWSKPCNTSNKGEINPGKKIFKTLSDQNKNFSKTNSPQNVNVTEKKPKQGGKEIPESKKPSMKKSDGGNPVDELSFIDREIELLRRKRELLANRNIKPQEAKSHEIKQQEIKQQEVKSQEVKPQEVKPQEIKARLPSMPSNSSKPKAIATRPENPENKLLKSVKPRQFLTPDMKKKLKRRRLDSDSEYDSELEDFIDDGHEENTDYSKHIREIFGYDKSRYRDLDDSECMESNFAQQMKEEYVSTKLGILEDLEDIRKEQEEKARKKMKKQGVGKR